MFTAYRDYKKGRFGLVEMDETHPDNDVASGKIVLHDVALSVGINFSTGNYIYFYR